MGYDRQRSPFATRLYLTCYCLFLLVNILLYSNQFSQIQKENIQTIFLCLISLILFSISFYGLWFANILILYLIIFLYSILLGLTFLLICFILTNNFSFTTSIYFSYNYIWLIKLSTKYILIINLLISCLLNIFALLGICHLCSCIEHHDEYWPYKKRTTQNVILK